MNTPEKAARTVAAVVVGVTGAGIDQLIHAGSVQADQPLTLLHGDGSRDRLNIMLLPYNGTTPEMLQEVAEDIFRIPPTDEFKNKVNVYTTNPLEDLKCDQNAICDWNGAVRREIDRIVATGVVPHETMVVIKSNEEFRGAGWGLYASRVQAPEIYTASAVVRPSVVPNNSREFRAADIAHELWGHTFAGFLHEGNDIMASPRAGSFFNDQHTQFLRQHFALTPQNYLTPKNEIKPLLVPAVSGQTLQSQEMSFSAVVYTPTGTTQLYSEIRPFNDDGPGVPDYIGDPAHIHAWSEIGRKIPAPIIGFGNYILLPDMTYTWKVCSSGVAVPIVDEKGKVIPNDPRWTQVEGWPGIFFPNPCAEIKIKTPIRDSSKIGLVTLAGGQETKNRTPTLTWNNGDPDVFYYEVQLSKDSTFNTDPATATAAVYWELRHGGMTTPLNSYTVPNDYPLEKSSTYYWRVRPRVQGDGKEVAWSAIGSFNTSSDAGVQTYSPELVDKDYGNGVIGPSRQQLEAANPQPEPIPVSALARVFDTENGMVFIPEAVLPRKEPLSLAA